MAARDSRAARTRSPRRREALLTFDALHIEGGLLAPEWLARVARLDAPHQDAADYQVPRGLNLRDEIGRYWRVAQAHFAEFHAGQRRGGDRAALAERFVKGLLGEAFGYKLEAVPPLVLAGRSYPVGLAHRGGTVPVIVSPCPAREGETTLDTPAMSYGDGVRRRTPFGLLQEVLNASAEMLWGVACDGDRLRLVRDNASLTRPAWIEADLLRIFSEERFADFTALWLLMHGSRFGPADQPIASCPLEVWREAGRQEGTRALGHLREGVQEALLALGGGFLAHPENSALRAALEDGSLSKDDYFQQLLRLVYRLIFLLTVEERDLLHPEGTTDEVRALYAEGYGLRRLRERAVRRSAHDRHEDLWEATRVVLRGLDAGEPRLGLPALAGLFAARQCPALDAARLENRHLLAAMFQLSWMRDDGSLARVNWRDMGPEELGSVYESLLELEPGISVAARTFRFSEGLAGNARKTTGSYYTPDSLVQVLLDSALEPVVRGTLAAHPKDGAEALLRLAIVDPACGSGHFLLAAARRLAAHVARAERDGTPSATDYRRALRKVVGRCIYGVDLNPMAIELCKVALWMEAVEPGLPLGFLDAHLRVGNALLGTTPELMAGGVPDVAFEPLDGDDKKVATLLKKRNRAEAAGQGTFTNAWSAPATEVEASAAWAALDAGSDADAGALAAKEAGWDALQASPAWKHAHLVADAWCAAFVWPKPDGGGPVVDVAPTTAVWRDLRDGRAPALLVQTVQAIAEQHRFFHWHLAFPTVYARGGFDVVLGNPPWDTLSPDRREFFGGFHNGMRSLSPAEQDAVVGSLLADPVVAAQWGRHQRDLFGLVHFLKNSGRFTLYAPGNLGKGDFNVFRMFTELALKSARKGGYAAQVLPGGLYGGANVSAIRRFLFDQCELRQLWGLSNSKRGWFAHVDISRFAAYAARRGGRTTSFLARFGLMEAADLAGKPVEFDADFVRENSPDTYAIPDVRSVADLTVAKKMLDAHPAFGDESAAPPLRHYQAEIHMGNDRDRFTTDLAGLPLYEGRMITHYDHRAKTYESGHGNSSKWIGRAHGDPEKAIVPQWRVMPDQVPDRLGNRCERYRLCFRDVAQPRDVRSFIAALVPPGVICGHKVPTITFERAYEWAYLPWLAVANSVVMDWMARSKLSSPSMTFSLVDSLPFPRPKLTDPWVQHAAPLVLRLVCTAPEMTPFWNKMADLGICQSVPEGTVPPEAMFDEGARDVARAELDALVARDVYGLSRAELSDVLDTFPVVKKRDVEAYGEYRTKSMILEMFDAMPEAMRTGVPYVTRLDPPPADARVAYPASTRPAWAEPVGEGE